MEVDQMSSPAPGWRCGCPPCDPWVPSLRSCGEGSADEVAGRAAPALELVVAAAGPAAENGGCAGGPAPRSTRPPIKSVVCRVEQGQAAVVENRAGPGDVMVRPATARDATRIRSLAVDNAMFAPEDMGGFDDMLTGFLDGSLDHHQWLVAADS